MFARREPGSVLVFEEHWRGRLWSAIPHRYVDAAPRRSSPTPRTAPPGSFASSVGLPAASGLTTGVGRLRVRGSDPAGVRGLDEAVERVLDTTAG